MFFVFQFERQLLNTRKGLFTYKVLPSGVPSRPAIFHRTMEGNLFQGNIQLVWRISIILWT